MAIPCVATLLNCGSLCYLFCKVGIKQWHIYQRDHRSQSQYSLHQCSARSLLPAASLLLNFSAVTVVYNELKLYWEDSD